MIDARWTGDGLRRGRLSGRPREGEIASALVVGRYGVTMLQVRVLGPLEVGIDRDRLGLGGLRRRALFAYLALQAGEVMSIDRICEDVWDGRPPAGAAGTVKTYVSQ